MKPSPGPKVRVRPIRSTRACRALLKKGLAFILKLEAWGSPQSAPSFSAASRCYPECLVRDGAEQSPEAAGARGLGGLGSFGLSHGETQPQRPLRCSSCATERPPAPARALEFQGRPARPARGKPDQKLPRARAQDGHLRSP